MVYNFNQYSLLEAKKDTSDFTLVYRMPSGSTGAYLYKDSKGEQWIVKFGAHEQQMWNEYTSNKLYNKAGIKVPDAYIGEIKGEKCVITQFLEGSVPLGYYKDDLSMLNKVCKGFLMDVLTANWDVVGTDSSLDNIRIWNGEPYRVDLGGSLLYRAMGADKSHMFNDTPSEHNTLRDEDMNYQASRIFAEIDDDYLRDAVRDVVKNYVLDDKVDHRAFMNDIKEVLDDEDNGFSEKEKRFLFKKLTMRGLNLYKMFN